MEALGRLLGLPSGLSGVYGEPPGEFLRPLGGLLEPLGAVLGPLGTVSLGYVATMQFQQKDRVRFGIDFEAQKAPQKGPKWSPKRTKIEHKNLHETRRLSRPSWIRRGPVLARLGVDVGVNNHEISLVFVRFREQSLF